jgi:hypothetical protein
MSDISEDIFHDWKESRFIIAPEDLVDKEKLVILTDYNYWADHTDELLNWCKEYGAVTQGMTVVLPDEKTLMAFALRWT